MEQNRVEYSKYCRVCADAQGERCEDAKRKSRRLDKNPNGAADVRDEILEPNPVIRLVESFAGTSHVAKGAQRGESGFCLAQPFSFETINLERQMRLDLVPKINWLSPSPEHRLTLLSLWSQDSSDRRRQPPPLLRLLYELFAAGSC